MDAPVLFDRQEFQLCADTGCSLKDLLRAINNRDGWQEEINELCAVIMNWWWWWHLYIYMSNCLIWVWVMIIFRWLFLFSSMEAIFVKELQWFPDRTIWSWPLNRRIFMPITWLGMALNRHRVCPLAFTSTMLLPMASEKKSFPFLPVISFNLVKVHNHLFFSKFHQSPYLLHLYRHSIFTQVFKF